MKLAVVSLLVFTLSSAVAVGDETSHTTSLRKPNHHHHHKNKNNAAGNNKLKEENGKEDVNHDNNDHDHVRVVQKVLESDMCKPFMDFIEKEKNWWLENNRDDEGSIDFVCNHSKRKVLRHMLKEIEGEVYLDKILPHHHHNNNNNNHQIAEKMESSYGMTCTHAYEEMILAKRSKKNLKKILKERKTCTAEMRNELYNLRKASDTLLTTSGHLRRRRHLVAATGMVPLIDLTDLFLAQTEGL